MTHERKLRSSTTENTVALLKGKSVIGLFYIGPGKPLSYKEWLRKSFYAHRSKPEKTAPCLRCDGKGWNYDPSDHCPVEGYKMADPITCPACNGTGLGEFEKVKLKYDLYCAELRADFEEELHQLKTVHTICQKLTKEELESLAQVKWKSDLSTTMYLHPTTIVLKV